MPFMFFNLVVELTWSRFFVTSNRRAIASTNEEYILIPRNVYVSIGGHEQVRNAIMEERALGKRAAKLGLNSSNLDGRDALHLKMFSNLVELWSDFQRGLAGTITSPLVLFLAVLIQILYVILPPILLGIGIALGSFELSIFGAAEIGLVLGTLTIFYARFALTKFTIFAPVAGLIIALASILGYAKRDSKFRFR